MIYLKIIDQKKFNLHDVSYSLTTSRNSFSGDVEIDGKTFSGDHGERDYFEYGFIIQNKDLREIIREARKAAGLTQLQLAQKIGVYQKDISNYERGVHDFGSATIQKIVEVLKNVTIYFDECTYFFDE